MNYNLLEEGWIPILWSNVSSLTRATRAKGWIPILWSNGKTDRMGIRGALTEAGRIRQIAASNPMDNVALLRLLLAVLQWCKPVATQDELQQLQLEKTEGIPSGWLEEKLGTRGTPNASFDLFCDTGGFYQDASIADKKSVAATNLLHDLPSGSKIAHFRHVRDKRDGLCWACCALGLVRWPGVASAGTAGRGHSMTASINGKTPTYSIPIGRTLLATLLLTWPRGHAVKGDAPVWDGASEQSPLGFLKGMTWRSRRVMLVRAAQPGKQESSGKRCCYCGEKADPLIRLVIFRPGWQRPSKEPWTDDPHLLRIGRKTGRTGKEKRIVPSWPSPNDPLEDHGATWRKILEGLLQRRANSQGEATEFYTTMLGTSQALYKHVGAQTVNLPAFGADAARCLLSEIEWLRQLMWITIAARAGKWRDPPKGHFIVGALCAPGAKGYGIRSSLCASSPAVEHDLEGAFQRLMQHLAEAGQTGDDAEQKIMANWRSEVHEIIGRHVRRVVADTTVGSPLRRREAIECAMKALDEANQSANAEKKEAQPEDKKSVSRSKKRGEA